MTIIKLTNKHREQGGEWLSETRLEYAKLLCEELRQTEPHNDWHLQTRGTHSDWHRFYPAMETKI